MKIFFFGAPYFSKEILQNLLEKGISIDTVITHPDRPVGRKKQLAPTPIKIFALENDIIVKEFYKLDDVALEDIRRSQPDLFIVASYGAILPAGLLSLAKFGALNVHPSLLPKLRGASPIQTSLLKGLKETGTTIMLMNKGTDTGDIVKQEKLIIQSTETYPQLEKRLITLSNELLIPIVHDIIKTNKKPVSTKQNNSEDTYTKIIKKQDGLINWNKPVQEIYNQWRAFYSWPKIYTIFNGQKLTLTEIELYSKNDIIKDSHSVPGKIYRNDEKDLLVGLSDGFLKINRLQLAGKNEMLAKDFLNGQPMFTKTLLK